MGGYSVSNATTKKIKKFQTAQLYAHYDNEIICKFNAKAKILGTNSQHILKDKFASSLSIKILNGNILHKSRFRLYTPKSRNEKNELFITTLFKEMNFLTPLTFFVDTEINGKKVGKFIFQEAISQSTISHNKRSKGVILRMNQRSQFMSVIPNYNKKTSSQFNLGMVSNIGLFSNELKINALDRINYLILQNYDRRGFICRFEKFSII